MEVKVRASANGAYADVIQPPAERDGKIEGEPTVVSSTAIAPGEELTLKVPGVTDPSQIEVGDVVDTPAEAPQGDQGGEEQPADGGGTPEPEPPAEAPQGAQGGGEQSQAEGMVPSIGRIVHLRLSEECAASINKRRADAQTSGIAGQNSGAIVHVGNQVVAGEVFPMVITRVWADGGPASPATAVNGQVLLDGNDTYWATSVQQGGEAGQWCAPPRV